MFLMAILLVMLILLTAFIIMAVGTGGAICIIVFGDVIVCIAGIICFINSLNANGSSHILLKYIA